MEQINGLRTGLKTADGGKHRAYVNQPPAETHLSGPVGSR